VSENEEITMHGDFPGLGDTAVLVYRLAVENGLLPADETHLAATLDIAVPDCVAAIAALTTYGLIALETVDGRKVHLPRTPETASAALLHPAEVALRAAERRLVEQRDAMAEVRGTLGGLMPVYLDAVRARTRSSAIEEISDLAGVRAAISQLVYTADAEVTTCQPGGGRPEPVLAEALPRDLAMLDRGIQMRTIYQHTARYHQPTQAYAETMISAGAQIRTLADIPDRMIIVDRRAAFIPSMAHLTGALLVRDPSLVAFLCRTFERTWATGTPFQIGPTAAKEASEDIKDSIVALLSNGLKDDVIAKRLGLSVRSCRRHIAEIMERLGARSRFQAGLLTARANPGEKVGQ
jgi:regulatory LuxR family protein